MSTGMIVAAAICGVVLITAAVRLRAEWLLNLCVRGVLGAVAIFFVNAFLEGRGIAPCVGVNAVTFVTSALLGFPGVCALYGIGFYGL